MFFTKSKKNANTSSAASCAAACFTHSDNANTSVAGIMGTAMAVSVFVISILHIIASIISIINLFIISDLIIAVEGSVIISIVAIIIILAGKFSNRQKICI